LISRNDSYFALIAVRFALFLPGSLLLSFAEPFLPHPRVRVEVCHIDIQRRRNRRRRGGFLGSRGGAREPCRNNRVRDRWLVSARIMSVPSPTSVFVALAAVLLAIPISIPTACDSLRGLVLRRSKCKSFCCLYGVSARRGCV
jgi:hypothetical protein